MDRRGDRQTDRQTDYHVYSLDKQPYVTKVIM